MKGLLEICQRKEKARLIPNTGFLVTQPQKCANSMSRASMPSCPAICCFPIQSLKLPPRARGPPYKILPSNLHIFEIKLLKTTYLGNILPLNCVGRVEHTWKSLIHDGDTVSVHRPSFYAERFKAFMSEKVFRKITPPLRPALSVRRSHGGYSRRTPRGEGGGEGAACSQVS